MKDKQMEIEKLKAWRRLVELISLATSGVTGEMDAYGVDTQHLGDAVNSLQEAVIDLTQQIEEL